MKPMMLYGLSLLVLLLAGVNGLSSCQGTLVGEDDPGLIDSDDYDPDSVIAVLERIEGNVKQLGSVTDPHYILTYPDSLGRGIRLSTGIPDSLQQDGLPVVFSGKVHPIPPDVFILGMPFTLTYIARREP